MLGGWQMAQEALFHEFSLERPLPTDHWVRFIQGL